MVTGRGSATGGWEVTAPPKGFKKENMGYFHALKWAFLSSLIRKYMLWEGFYHDFNTKKVSASGGLCPLTPTKGLHPLDPRWGRCPLDPRGNFAPSNDLPIDIEYNKRLDHRRPCWEDDLNGGSNLQYKVTNQFDAVVVVQYFVLAIISSLV